MSHGPVVGVVGPDSETVGGAVRAHGGVPNAGTASGVLGDCDYAVAVGEPALLSVARATPAVPVLPVDAGRGVRSVPRNALGSAVEALLAAEYDCEAHSLLAVSVADRTADRVLQDVMLVTEEPAKISEFAVHADGERVGRFRADGVVVATPAGSSGYARAAGGPVVPPGTDAVVAVPVAPFSTDVDHWVLPANALTLSVERDETTVQLIADDRVAGVVEPADPVRIRPTETVPVAVVDDSRSPF